MEKKNRFALSADALRVLLIVLGSIFSTLVLVFAVMAITQIQQNNVEIASIYLLGIFIVLGLSRLVTFLKERTKLSFIRFLSLLVFDVALGIIILFAKDNPYLYSLTGGLYCLSIIFSRILKIFQNKTVRNIIYNIVIIIFALLLGIALFIPYEGSNVSDVVLIICTIVAITAFIEVISNAGSQIKVKILFKIIMRTFALEIILGLFTIMIAFSLVFMLYEDGINNFPDALWYSFAVVTTIGFGDFTAVTPIGRILTVFLGAYGIVVVAVITSIIVNFYNETAGKQDAAEMKEINKEENKVKKK